MSAVKGSARHRIIVIDDNEAIHADFRKVLAGGETPSSLAAAKAALFGPAAGPATTTGARPQFDVDSALQGQDGFEKVKKAVEDGSPYSVAFVDMRMPPGWDGLKTIKHIWECDPAIQVVICTAFSDYSMDQVNADLGPSDRLLILKKPFDNVEILQLAGALSEKWSLSREAALKREELEQMVHARTAEIEHALLHDKLTGLANRALLAERLNASIGRCQRHPDYRFALLFLDFDRFKIINDSLGHEMGDLLLIEVAKRLGETIRSTDLVSHTSTPARLGGDEFILLLEDLREEHDAARVAERLLKLLSEPYMLNSQKVYVTASIGIATSDRHYERVGDMIRDADTAMYRAKAAGRARYVMFDGRMHEEVKARLQLEGDLRRAVEESEFTLHYQPIVHLASGRLAGFEALVRWNHPERGLVSAADFVPVAEDTGVIRPLSLWVLQEACRQVKEWENRYPDMGSLLMSVNLSRKQLVDPELVNQIAGTIEQAGIDPNNLALEITESAVLDDPATAIEILERLRRLGIWLHLDDFGTGQSSLGCLYQFPLTGLKIDRAFIMHVCERPEHAAVLRAVVDIAKAFNFQVVAEGVETAEQLALLRTMSCDHAQGYFFSRPQDAAATEAYLQRTQACCAPTA